MDDKSAAVTTGAAVRAELARAGLSQRELARRLNVSHTYITMRTKGVIAFNVTDLARVAEVLDIPVAVLVAQPVRANGSAA